MNRSMKQVPVEKAVGMVAAHDMTRIIPGEYKGAAFRKGHVIVEDDVEVLKSMGKEHIYIYEVAEGDLHENDAAKRLATAVAGGNLTLTEAVEGKVDLVCRKKGMLEIDLKGLEAINALEGIIVATRHRGLIINEGEKVASAKIIPLVIHGDTLDKSEAVTSTKSIVNILPLKPLKVGVVVTGTEVYSGRIKDAFGPVLVDKVNKLGGTVIKTCYAPDDHDMIEKEIQGLLKAGCELIMVSGGMSVDPDDLSPSVIREVATEVISYGSPMLPGAMFMMAYLDKIADSSHEGYSEARVPIIGVPACGMFNKVTVLDIILPYIFAGVPVTKKLILSKAHGGLCLRCEQCVYPHCEFGKG